jgi:Putative peptidoglycan binding domain
MPKSPYVVREGEYLLQIATRMGFDPDEVWNDPKHDSLRKAGRTPNQLCTGDVLYIPERKRSWFPVSVGAKNSFTTKVPKVKVSVAFAGLENAACVVHGLAAPNTFTTDAAGTLEFECSVHAETFDVEFPDHSRHRVCVGHLDPIAAPSGQFHRLQHLGYLQGSTTFEEAVAAFQRDQALPVTGQMDETTQSNLESSHGG